MHYYTEASGVVHVYISFLLKAVNAAVNPPELLRFDLSARCGAALRDLVLSWLSEVLC